MALLALSRIFVIVCNLLIGVTFFKVPTYMVYDVNVSFNGSLAINKSLCGYFSDCQLRFYSFLALYIFSYNHFYWQLENCFNKNMTSGFFSCVCLSEEAI